MKRITLIFIILACFNINSFSQKLYLVVNRGPFKTVKDAAFGEKKVNFFDTDFSDDRACTESFAAIELAFFISKITSIHKDSIYFIQPKKIPKSGSVILLGSKYSNNLISKYKKRQKIRFTSKQSYNIQSFKSKDQLITIIEGSDRIGTMYGVFRYLEELGLKFIGLGEKGIVYPKNKVKLQKSLNFTENPSYLTRGYWAWGDRKVNNDFFMWMARNKMNFWTADSQPVYLLKKLGIKLTEGGHIIQKMFIDPELEYPYNHSSFKYDKNKPSDPYKIGLGYIGDENNDGKLSYYEAHSEWYGLQNGVRSKNFNNGGDNFCTSNSDARKELAINMTKSLVNGKWKFVDIVNFWMLDYGRWCTCDKCKKDGSETDKLFLVVDEILNEIKKAKEKKLLTRKVEISSIAYLKTITPPTRPLPENFDYKNSSITFFPIGRCYAHAFADSNCTEVNKGQLEAYRGWISGDKRFYNGSIFIGEYYNISSFKTMPLVFSNIISIDIPWYFKNKARHFHYMHVPTKLWGTWTLNQYLLSKILWNVKIDSRSIIDEYFVDFYPTTSENTRKMYEKLELASKNIKLLKNYVTGTAWNFLNSKLLKGDMFQFEHMQYDSRSNSYNDAPSIIETLKAIEDAKFYIEQSLVYCADSIELERLLIDKERFDYGYNMFRYIYHMIRTSMFHKQERTLLAKLEFAEVDTYAQKLKQITDIVKVSSEHANAKNGFKATQSIKEYNEFKELYGVKIN